MKFAFHLFNEEAKERDNSSLMMMQGYEEEEKEQPIKLSQTQAFYLYIETKLKPFVETMKMSTQAWREA